MTAAKRGKLAGLGVVTPARHDAMTPEKPTKAARGSADKPRLSIRFADHGDWMAAHELALTRGKSLNELFLEAFGEMQERAGLKPVKSKP